MLVPGPAEPPLHSAVWRAIVERCEAAWPLEACGLVVDGALVATSTAPSACDAFRLCGADALLLERALRRGADVILWHSHTTPGATPGMSPRDIAAAAPGGDPLHPGVRHLVVDLRGGPQCAGGAIFRWRNGGFEPATRLGPPKSPAVDCMPVAPEPRGSQHLRPA